MARADMSSPMSVERAVLAVSGAVVVLSLAMSLVFSPWWLALAALVALDMVQSAFTGFSPAARLFKKMGLKSGRAFG